MGISDFYNQIGSGVSKVGNSLSHLLDSAPITYTAPIKPVLPKPVIDTNKFLKAIATNETGGVKGNPYQFSQPSGDTSLGKALGKYQVTEGELKTYGKKFLGKNITPQQYLNSPEIQDNYLLGKANYYGGQGYAPQDIADIHRRGLKNSYPANSGQYQDPNYVNKFNLIYNQ